MMNPNPWMMAALLVLTTACANSETKFKTPPEGSATDPAGAGSTDPSGPPTTLGAGDAGSPADDATFAGAGGNAVVDAEGLWTPERGDFVLRDQQTGSLWNLRGEAYSGPLRGQRLRQIPAFNAFWFAWSAFNDGSEIWDRDANNQTGPVTTGDNCLVPCDEIRLACGGGKDCIPALDYDGRDDRPVAQMVGVDSPGAAYLDDGDFVLGVVIEGEARAVPHNLMWWHEIYNDRIGDTDYSVTFCPLTGSGIVFAGTHDGEAVDYGVSGNLYNSNLVLFDRQTDTFWSQLLQKGISGPQMGEELEVLPVVETTWARWREMYPDTLVATDDTGYTRNYDSYPYGDYRTNDADTFRPTNPLPDDLYEAKERVLGIPASSLGTTRGKAYALKQMDSHGDRLVINDTFEEHPVLVVYEKAHRFAVPFDPRVQGDRLTFEGIEAP